MDPDQDLGGSSSVGSVFFPLRRCNTGKNQDPDGFRDLGVKEKGQNGDYLIGKGQVLSDVELSDSRNSASKRKFQDPVSETTDAVNSFITNKKAENGGAEKDSVSVKIGENADSSTNSKRKLQDLGDFFDKPIDLDGFRGVKSSRNGLSNLEQKVGKVAASGAIKILTYNVWFREDLEMHKRMQAIGDLIQQHSPDIVCFQEVTPNIYDIFQKSAWWKKYRCSVPYERAATEVYFCIQLAKLPVKSFICRPFSYTAMGRELCITEIETNSNKSLVIATSHLESPCPGPPTWDQMFSKERVNQAKEAVSFLQKYPNAVFCGDMNWDDKLDGQFPFVEGWFDAWEKLRPGEIGWTYDTKSNKMLSGNRALQKRLDRFICKLPDFDVSCIDMIGTEVIPGLTYNKQKKMKNKIQELSLPVLPSDHYGLLLTIANL